MIYTILKHIGKGNLKSDTAITVGRNMTSHYEVAVLKCWSTNFFLCHCLSLGNWWYIFKHCSVCPWEIGGIHLITVLNHIQKEKLFYYMMVLSKQVFFV